MAVRIAATAKRAARTGTIALAALSMLATHLPAQTAAQDPRGAMTEFSSEHNPKISAGTPRGPARSNPAPRTNFVQPKNFQQKTFQQKTFQQKTIAPRNLQVVPGGPGPRFRAVGPRGPAVGFRGPVGMVRFHGVNANFIRGPHRFFRNGNYIPFVALSALAAITIGAVYYAPYAYVDGPSADICTGPTEDGTCELRMTEVPLEDGSSEMQCVAYCPQQ